MIIHKKTTYTTGVVAIILFLFGFQIALEKTASASYDAGRLLDNNTLLDAGSMNIEQVQSFLNDRGGQIANKSFVLDCDAAGSQAKQMYQSLNAPCGQSILASQIIYYASNVYGINPKVIMATMQKEQSIITATNPTNRQYAQAMGYSCPTTGDCNSSSNFFWQIDNGAWVLRYHFERARGNMNWWSASTTWTCGVEKDLYKPNLYPFQNVRFFDTNGTQYAVVYIQNAATSSFYCYTPHVYNNPQGLYGRSPYGSTGLYYSGSYNFVLFYEQWFGSTKTLSYDCDSKVAQVICVWSLRKTDGSQFLTTSKNERDITIQNYGWIYEGIAFYGSTTARSGMVPVLRMRDSNKHFYLTDHSEYNTMLTNGWADEGVAFYAYPPSTSTSMSHKVYRMYHPTYSVHAWTTSEANRNSMSQNGYLTESGSFNSVSGTRDLPAPPSGRNNIYRLRQNSGYFYTSELVELESVLRLGYDYEGLLTTANSANNGTPVYRLRSGNTHFYTSNIHERDQAVSRYGYTYEGIAFYLDTSSSKIYRINNRENIRLYTSNINEVMSLVNIGGWSYEGSLNEPNSTAIPVYRLLHLDTGKHFYTSSVEEVASIVNRGWKFENLAFTSSSSSNGSPIYRLRLHGRHLYTINPNERDQAVSRYGYTYEGIAFYVSNNPLQKPVYRLRSQGSEHLYTINPNERDQAVSRYGYTYEGIAFYVSNN